jgi:hypothetical protein
MRVLSVDESRKNIQYASVYKFINDQKLYFYIL